MKNLKRIGVLLTAFALFAMTSYNSGAVEFKKLALQVGQTAPDIKLPDIKGNTLQLSSLKNKVVLLRFWVSWDKESRATNANLAKLHKQYKQQKFGNYGNGFEVFTISVDSDKKEWINAVKKDKLPGKYHTNDFYSKYAAEYQINKLPAMFLLDGKGKVIGKQLSFNEVEEMLAKTSGGTYTPVAATPPAAKAKSTATSKKRTNTKNKSKQTTSKPPVKSVVSSGGKAYKIQLGAYKKFLLSDFYGVSKYGNISTEDVKNGIKRVLLGDFNSSGAAVNALDKVKEEGYADAFIVKYNNGSRGRAMGMAEVKKARYSSDYAYGGYDKRHYKIHVSDSGAGKASEANTSYAPQEVPVAAKPPQSVKRKTAPVVTQTPVAVQTPVAARAPEPIQKVQVAPQPIDIIQVEPLNQGQVPTTVYTQDQYVEPAPYQPAPAREQVVVDAPRMDDYYTQQAVRYTSGRTATEYGVSDSYTKPEGDPYRYGTYGTYKSEMSKYYNASGAYQNATKTYSGGTPVVRPNPQGYQSNVSNIYTQPAPTPTPKPGVVPQGTSQGNAATAIPVIPPHTHPELIQQQVTPPPPPPQQPQQSQPIYIPIPYYYPQPSPNYNPQPGTPADAAKQGTTPSLPPPSTVPPMLPPPPPGMPPYTTTPTPVPPVKAKPATPPAPPKPQYPWQEGKVGKPAPKSAPNTTTYPNTQPRTTYPNNTTQPRTTPSNKIRKGAKPKGAGTNSGKANQGRTNNQGKTNTTPNQYSQPQPYSNPQRNRQGGQKIYNNNNNLPNVKPSNNTQNPNKVRGYPPKGQSNRTTTYTPPQSANSMVPQNQQPRTTAYGTANSTFGAPTTPYANQQPNVGNGQRGVTNVVNAPQQKPKISPEGLDSALDHYFEQYDYTGLSPMQSKRLKAKKRRLLKNLRKR